MTIDEYLRKVRIIDGKIKRLDQAYKDISRLKKDFKSVQKDFERTINKSDSSWKGETQQDFKGQGGQLLSAEKKDYSSIDRAHDAINTERARLAEQKTQCFIMINLLRKAKTEVQNTFN